MNERRLSGGDRRICFQCFQERSDLCGCCQKCPSHCARAVPRSEPVLLVPSGACVEFHNMPGFSDGLYRPDGAGGVAPVQYPSVLHAMPLHERERMFTAFFDTMEPFKYTTKASGAVAEGESEKTYGVQKDGLRLQDLFKRNARHHVEGLFRHILDLEVFAAGLAYMPGPKLSAEAIQRLATVLAHSDNAHDVGTRELNVRDRVAAQKILTSFWERRHVVLDAHESAHVRAAIDFVHRHYDELGAAKADAVLRMFQYVVLTP